MRKVLLISYTFPPQYDVSARRAAKLCKYLPATGWQPVVLTKDWTRDIAPEDARAYTVVSHPEALNELQGVTVVRAPYHTHDNALRRLHERLGGVYEKRVGRDAPHDGGNAHAGRSGAAAPARWTPRAVVRRTLSLISPTFGDFPDAFRGWVTAAVRRGVEVTRQEPIDAICSLCPPATAHVVASEIARRTGLPWVAQFDDLYSFHLERQRRAEWRAYADLRHKAWMRPATLAGAITPAMLRYVQETYRLDGDVVHVGFDPEERPVAKPPSRSRLQLAYTGSVYPGDQRPELLFEALERVIEKHGDQPPIEVLFAGTGCDAELQAALSRFPNAARACVFLGRLSPTDALRLQRESDALVLLNCTSLSPDEGTLSFPAKAFEYLHAGRPILALPRDPGGWGDSLLETTRAGITVNTAADAAAVLESWVAAWRSHGTLAYAGDPEEIARYSQPRQAQALGRLLDRAAAARPS